MSYYRKDQFPIPRRRFLTIACVALISLVFLSILGSSSWTVPRLQYFDKFTGDRSPGAQSDTVQVDKFHYQNYVKGPPTNKFRDNLLPNVKYISSWISAGWTNDVMTYINLIYLGYITNRVPVIGMFTPSHIGSHVPPISFEEVFDVPRFTKAMNAPLLEWHQVKNRSSEEVDELGCWSVWEAVKFEEGQGTVPRGSPALDLLKLDISFTRAPSWIKSIPRYEYDQHSSFAAVSTLAFPETRAESIVEPRESPQHHVKLPPDEQMLCFDYLYYVCSHQPYEFDFDFSPAWSFVGQHLYWTPKLETLADSYLRRAFSVQDHQETPPYIAIHIRHGDFSVYCGDGGVEGCFSPLSVIARRVDEVKQELLERKGLVVNHVVMTSDERNATWWEDVTSLGWFGLDHSQTVELYGDWYPVLIDAVVQAGGIGFVGTDRSTMSILARRRVESWWKGAARMVKWGNPHADDH